MNFDLHKHTVLLTVAGSRAYGIHTPTSDLDVKGVAIPPLPYYLGVSNKFEQADGKEHILGLMPHLSPEIQAVATEHGVEGSVYEWRKFLTLAADCNPNILDVLFCRDEDVLLQTLEGTVLRRVRDLFLSAKARFTFGGYAHAQMKRIRGHRAWLLNPPTHKPTRGEYGLPEHTLIPADHLAAIKAAVQKQIDRWEVDFGDAAEDIKIAIQEQVASNIADMRTALGLSSDDDARFLAAARMVGCDDNLILVMQREREYEAAARSWKQYQEWVNGRNAARAELEAKYGYDTKHGGHLYRLMIMCEEILTTGRVHVWRGPNPNDPAAPNDAEQILAIRRGAWNYDQLDTWFEKQDARCDAIYKEKRYTVPHQPDRTRIDGMCQTVLANSLLSIVR